VLLTIASEYKFEARTPPGFLDLVVPAIEEEMSTTLFAVGPSDSGRWHEANMLTAGRVRPLGILSDPAPYAAAADLYLDSCPSGSITSLLESAALGTPCLAYVGGRDPDSLIVSDPPIVVDAILRASDPAEFRRLLDRLISEPEYRTQIGTGLVSQVRAAHSPDRWLARLEGVYDQLGRVGRVERPVAPMTAFAATTIDLEIVNLPTARHGPLALAEILATFRGDRRPLKGHALLRKALRLRNRFPARRSGDSSILPRWWPLIDRFVVR
jgi:hypothetical protein